MESIDRIIWRVNPHFFYTVIKLKLLKLPQVCLERRKALQSNLSQRSFQNPRSVGINHEIRNPFYFRNLANAFPISNKRFSIVCPNVLVPFISIAQLSPSGLPDARACESHSPCCTEKCMMGSECKEREKKTKNVSAMSFRIIENQK